MLKRAFILVAGLVVMMLALQEGVSLAAERSCGHVQVHAGHSAGVGYVDHSSPAPAPCPMAGMCAGMACSITMTQGQAFEIAAVERLIGFVALAFLRRDGLAIPPLLEPPRAFI